ncbi:hypothetical protein D3C86_1632090 [compost metagenome]
MAEEGDDLVDALFHAVEVGEGRIAADHLVGEDPRQSRVGGGIHQLRLADGLEHALGRTGVGQRILLAQVEILLQGVFLLARSFVALLEMAENAHHVTSLDALTGRGPRAGMNRPACGTGLPDPSLDPQWSYYLPGSRWSGFPFCKSLEMSIDLLGGERSRKIG